eukprot:CAMPEP_0171761812 /NCGR_PEP_ID=MMETSP0991-20121206/48295_1 /TAXON_ID=483369 /ORGANISM="non described non described, Strain CCMP2098" /LENGTH=90 /DNA_ID=CAMNT_0012365179 /DNA_START=208 /DNA_END=477 /DNA_ORIENTATION=+
MAAAATAVVYPSYFVACECRQEHSATHKRPDPGGLVEPQEHPQRSKHGLRERDQAHLWTRQEARPDVERHDVNKNTQRINGHEQEKRDHD